MERRPIFRQRRQLHLRQKIFPNQVEHCLHITNTTRDGNHRILVRHDQAELSKRAVSTISTMPAPPELVSIPLRPVNIGIASIRYLRTGRFFNPLHWQDLFSQPGTLLQVHLAEPCDIFGPDAQAPSTNVDAPRAAIPGWILDTQGVE